MDIQARGDIHSPRVRGYVRQLVLGGIIAFIPTTVRLDSKSLQTADLVHRPQTKKKWLNSHTDSTKMPPSEGQMPPSDRGERSLKYNGGNQKCFISEEIHILSL